MATFSNNLATEKGAKVQHTFYCQDCDFVCSKKYCWERHIMTSKHIKSTNSNILSTEKGAKCQTETAFICEHCDKQYKDRSGLWRHKKLAM
jgi:hypothetical protein